MAIELGYLPHLQQDVTVVGYPIGGETVSFSTGVVSRIDFGEYTQAGGEQNLCIQIDAGIGR